MVDTHLGSKQVEDIDIQGSDVSPDLFGDARISPGGVDADLAGDELQFWDRRLTPNALNLLSKQWARWLMSVLQSGERRLYAEARLVASALLADCCLLIAPVRG